MAEDDPMRGWDWNHIMLISMGILLAFAFSMVISAIALEIVRA